MATHYKSDTDKAVFFYEQEFYPFSSFSSFTINWKGHRFDTCEAAYHWEKFHHRPDLQAAIQLAPSAHEAFSLAQENKVRQRRDWKKVRVQIMREIVWAKITQHEYVRRKLLQTGNRQIVEDSWRDSFWGWGPKKTGKNTLGKIWMQARTRLRKMLAATTTTQGERALNCGISRYQKKHKSRPRVASGLTTEMHNLLTRSTALERGIKQFQKTHRR